MKSYADFNGIRHDDGDKIIGFNRMKAHVVWMGDIDVCMDLYIIRLKYRDGTYKDIRTYCECGTSRELSDSQEKEEFFVKRLFGENGLFVKEGRNDYIFLGGIDKSINRDKYRFSRFNKADNGKTLQQIVDEYLSEKVFPNLTFKNMNEDFDFLNMSYFYHSGNEDMDDVFREGLRSRFARVGSKGFASLGSIFYPSNLEINNLYDSVRQYGNSVNRGHHVFILRIPNLYRGLVDSKGQLYPPLPTHRLIDYSTGDCYIIPEIIYGMYDTDTGILHRNPNYKSKYDPAGLVYDEETAEAVLCRNEFDWYKFMESRREIPYSQLLKRDRDYGVFNDICKLYGIQQNVSNTNIRK